jgi:hypothetical protein
VSVGVDVSSGVGVEVAVAVAVGVGVAVSVGEGVWVAAGVSVGVEVGVNVGVGVAAGLTPVAWQPISNVTWTELSPGVFVSGVFVKLRVSVRVFPAGSMPVPDQGWVASGMVTGEVLSLPDQRVVVNKVTLSRLLLFPGSGTQSITSCVMVASVPP